MITGIHVYWPSKLVIPSTKKWQQGHNFFITKQKQESGTLSSVYREIEVEKILRTKKLYKKAKHQHIFTKVK